jgi:hypothetical protein
MKIYFVRHQAAGVVYDYPFLQPPSEEQIAAVKRRCFQSFGAEHPKLGEFQTSIYETEALGPDEIPVVAERALGVAGAAPVGEFSVSGVATVTPRKA